MTLQPGEQTIVIHILPYKMQSDNNILIFGQLIECNMRKIFQEKSYAKCGNETSPRPFSAKLNLSISPD